MATTSIYKYSAFFGGKRVSGQQRAETPTDAIDILSRRGLDVFKIDEQKAQKFSFLKILRNFTGNELSTRLTFFRGYAALEAEGVPFDESFGLLIAQMPPKSRFSRAVQAVLRSLNQGDRDSLSGAMSDHADEFSHLECALVGAGEKSRGRAEVLDRLAAFLERDAKLRKRLMGALTYPVLVVSFSGVLIAYILFFLLPIFANLYTSFNLPMPPAMTGALGFAAMLKNPIWDLCFLIALGTFGFFFGRWASTPEGAIKLDKFLLSDLKVGPIKFNPFGAIRRKTITSRTCRAFAALMASGVDVEQALETSIPVAASPFYARALNLAKEDLSTGISSSLSEALTKFKAFDAYALGFLAIGERVAQIPDMMMRLASYYDDDVESLLSSLPETIQTVVIILLGVLVSYLAYIVYVPMATLSTSVH